MQLIAYRLFLNKVHLEKQNSTLNKVDTECPWDLFSWSELEKCVMVENCLLVLSYRTFCCNCFIIHLPESKMLLCPTFKANQQQWWGPVGPCWCQCLLLQFALGGTEREPKNKKATDSKGNSDDSIVMGTYNDQNWF